jgi:hypothetical protein
MRARREAIEDARRRALPGYRARTPRGTDDDRAGGCLRSEFVSTAVVPASDESLRALGSKYGRHKGGRS